MVVEGLKYGRPERAQAQTFVTLAGQTFSFDPAQWLSSLDAHGWDNMRALTASDDSFVAGLVLHTAGQWFGRRRLAAYAVSAVVVAPPFRGERVGRRLMLEGLRETRAAGIPLSVLYASTPAFYRSVGYEPAGERRFCRAPITALPSERLGARYVELAPEQQAEARELYQRFARERSGLLERTDHFWRSHFQPYDGSKRSLYRIDFPEGPEGYVSFQHGFPEKTLVVDDAIATTPRSVLALLSLFSRYQPQAQWVRFPDGAGGPIHQLIADYGACPDAMDDWLLRITDVAAALAGRGYPPLDAVLELEVVDAALPENGGRYKLRVSGGGGVVERGGAGRLRLDVRALAAIFSGFKHPREMLAAGLLHAVSDDEVELLGAVFAGPRPFMLDSF